MERGAPSIGVIIEHWRNPENSADQNWAYYRFPKNWLGDWDQKKGRYPSLDQALAVNNDLVRASSRSFLPETTSGSQRSSELPGPHNPAPHNAGPTRTEGAPPQHEATGSVPTVDNNADAGPNDTDMGNTEGAPPQHEATVSATNMSNYADGSYQHGDPWSHAPTPGASGQELARTLSRISTSEYRGRNRSWFHHTTHRKAMILHIIESFNASAIVSTRNY